MLKIINLFENKPKDPARVTITSRPVYEIISKAAGASPPKKPKEGPAK